jgi:transposase
MLKKNSSNSNKPPSTDPLFNNAKANNEKIKSGKKVGGQLGHKGHRLTPSPCPDVIIEKMPPDLCTSCGGDVIIIDGFESRQIMDIEVTVTVTEERAHRGQCEKCSLELSGDFSEGFNSHVGYGSNVKAAVAMLNADANVPIHKTAVFISSLTQGRINMSDGTIVNITAELAKKFGPTVQDIVLALASCGMLNVDETGVRVNGNLTWMQIISNENYSLYGRSLKRGSLNDVMNSLIMLFTGVLVHDHLKSYYGFNHLSHAECNVHILRYLKAVSEIMKHPWAKEMADLLVDANKRKKELIEAGFSGMDEDEFAAICGNFINILDRGQNEYDSAIDGKKNITYYEEERRLLNRLRKYMDEHLCFLSNFKVPFSNNGAEHGARHVKGKQKTSGGFRSDGGVDNYAVIASVIATLRKQGMHIFSAIRDAFQGACPTFADTS